MYVLSERKVHHGAEDGLERGSKSWRYQRRPNGGQLQAKSASQQQNNHIFIQALILNSCPI